MSVVFAAGGTGGHLYPALYTACALRRREPSYAIHFFISSRERDRELCEAYGFSFEPLVAKGIGSPVWRHAVPAAIRLGRDVPAARHILKRWRASVVVGFGAYVACAPVLAARSLGIKVVVHEQNAVMGRTNRLCAPWAHRVLWGLPPLAGGSGEQRDDCVGIPVKPGILDPPARDTARAFLGLREGTATLLVMGGSLGAKAVNRLLLASAEHLARMGDIQAIHLSGGNDYAMMVKGYRIAGVRATVLPYLNEMEWAYAAADFAICRSGAATVAELAQAGVPALLIPYPDAVGDHQTANAKVLHNAGGAMLRRQDETTPAVIAAFCKKLLTSPETKERMSGAAHTLARPDAAERVAGIIVALARGEC